MDITLQHLYNQLVAKIEENKKNRGSLSEHLRDEDEKIIMYFE